MSKLLVVFGATGQQGGSVVDYVINDPELSREYKVRAVTRDLSKPAAQSLKARGVEVVTGDADDKEALESAMQGAHTVFAVTVTVFDDNLYPREFAQGKALADAAVATGVQYFTFSTLPHVGELSGGKIKHVMNFDVKADIEDYIRTLPMKSAFFAPGFFMQNLHQNMGPQPVGDGTYAIANFVTPDTQLPFIDTIDDTGKYIGAIIAEPGKYERRVFSAATRIYSYTEVADIMSKVSGKTIKYNQLPQEVFRGFLPPGQAETMVDMFAWAQDFGYYGPETKELVEATARQARGKLTTLEEYLEKHPLVLQ